MLSDKAYPKWTAKQRLEIAHNQFIQGVHHLQTIELIRDKPTTLMGLLK